MQITTGQDRAEIDINYEAFIQEFPNGIFKSLALIRIAKYSKPKTVPIDQKKEAVNFSSLRSKPEKIGEVDLTNLIHKHNFFDSERNISGSFDNSFTDNGDNTITEAATGLIWQKSGSKSSMSYGKIVFYINKLNDMSLAGHSDWRLPTLEELGSLLQNNHEDKGYINDIFDMKYQIRLWSSDLVYDSIHIHYGESYVLDIKSGTYKNATLSKSHYIDGIYSINPKNWVKAVRKINSPK